MLVELSRAPAGGPAPSPPSGEAQDSRGLGSSLAASAAPAAAEFSPARSLWERRGISLGNGGQRRCFHCLEGAESPGLEPGIGSGTQSMICQRKEERDNWEQNGGTYCQGTGTS